MHLLLNLMTINYFESSIARSQLKWYIVQLYMVKRRSALISLNICLHLMNKFNKGTHSVHCTDSKFAVVMINPFLMHVKP